MQERPGIVQRAFEIAKSGKVANTAALRAQLAGEGYANATQFLAGRSLALQLTRMIAEARGVPGTMVDAKPTDE